MEQGNFVNPDQLQRKVLTGYKKSRKAESEIRRGESEYRLEEKEIGVLEVAYHPGGTLIATSIQGEPTYLHVREVEDIFLTPPRGSKQERVSLLDFKEIPYVRIYVPLERQENYMYVKPDDAEPYVLVPPLESTVDLFILLHELGHVAQEEDEEFKKVMGLIPNYVSRRGIGPVKQFGPLKKVPQALPDLPYQLTDAMIEAIDRIDAISKHESGILQSHLAEVQELEGERVELMDEEEAEVEDVIKTLIGNAISLPELFDLHQEFSDRWQQKSSRPDQLRELEQEYLADLKTRGVIMSRRLCDPHRNPFQYLLNQPISIGRLESGAKGLRVSFDRYGEILLFDPNMRVEKGQEEFAGGRTVEDVDTRLEDLKKAIATSMAHMEEATKDAQEMLIAIKPIEAFLRKMLERDASGRALKWIHEVKRKGIDISMRMRVPWRHTVEGGLTETSPHGRIILFPNSVGRDEGPNVIKSPIDEIESALLSYRANIKTMRKEYGGKMPGQLQPRRSPSEKT